MKTQKQAQKNCQSFVNYLYDTDLYPIIRDLLFEWKQTNQLNINAIHTFQKISKILKGQNYDQILFERFNRCLVKNISSGENFISLENFTMFEKRVTSQPDDVLLNFKQWIDEDDYEIEKKPQSLQIPNKISNSVPLQPNIQIMKDEQFLQKILNKNQRAIITKIITLYIKCIISKEELRTLLSPLLQKEPSLFYWINKYAEIIKIKRYKRTIFSPLIELIGYKYPLQQVGISYIRIPDGYANYSSTWKKTHPAIEGCLNRKCVSVPLVGSEEQFFISPKTDPEREMFIGEDEGYQIDYNMQCIKASIKMIQKYAKSSQTHKIKQRFENSMIKKIVSELYPIENVYAIFMRNIELMVNVLLPRLKQKCLQLQNCRQKFLKNYTDIANKMYYKGLDYRYFHFTLNDKKFNSVNFWEREIHLRKQTILHQGQKELQKNDQQQMMQEEEQNSNGEFSKEEKKNEDKKKKYNKQESSIFVRSRYQPVNSFDNVLGKYSKKNIEEQEKYGIILREGKFHQEEFDLRIKEQQLKRQQQNKRMQQQFEHRLESTYPKYPENQLLFILDFSRRDILNDVLQIILHHCPANRKRLFQLLIFKLFRVNIAHKLSKYSQDMSGLESFIDEQNRYPNNKQKDYLLNQSRAENGSRATNYKNSEDQFIDMIEEEEEIANLDDQQSPFELPKGKQFSCLIGTKPVYIIMRAILTLYQRFLIAKEYDEKDKKGFQSNYANFLSVLIYKIKEKKVFEDLIRKIFSQDGYIFYTLDKIVNIAIKTISSITNNDLTYKILKNNTKDFELELFGWENYPFPSTTTQLLRLYKQRQKLFSFNFEPISHRVYISCWYPPFHDVKQIQQSQEMIQSYLTSPIEQLNYKHTPAIHTKEQCHYLYMPICQKLKESPKRDGDTNRQEQAYKGYSIIINEEKWSMGEKQMAQKQTSKLRKLLQQAFK